MAGGAPPISPQMLQMLAAGGAPAPAAAQGQSGAAPGGPGAAPQAAALGRLLQGQRMTPQGGGEMESKILEQCMMQIGKVIQTVMLTNPKAYQALLKAQMSLHTGLQELKQNVQENQEHQQMTSSIMQMLQSTPGAGGGATPGGPR